MLMLDVISIFCECYKVWYVFFGWKLYLCLVCFVYFFFWCVLIVSMIDRFLILFCDLGMIGYFLEVIGCFVVGSEVFLEWLMFYRKYINFSLWLLIGLVMFKCSFLLFVSISWCICCSSNDICCSCWGLLCL